MPHHVTQRGNGQRTIFHSDEDRKIYLQLLREYGERYAVRWWGYCLMDNHVHLVACSSDEGKCAGKGPAPSAFRLRPVCERETPNEWSLLAKPLLLVSSGPDPPMDGARLRGTKSRTSGNVAVSRGLPVVERPHALSGRRCIRISGPCAMAAELFTRAMARHPGDGRRRGGGIGTDSRIDTYRKTTRGGNTTLQNLIRGFVPKADSES